MTAVVAASTVSRTRWKKISVGTGCAIAGLYAIAVIAIMASESKLIFPAPDQFPSTTPAAANLPFEDLHILVDGSSQIHAWWISSSAPTSKVLLYFHGNGYSLESEATTEAPLFHQTGVNLLLADYRGYGTSSNIGTSGPSTEADARAAMNYLVQVRHIDPSDVVIAGWSIGSAVATKLAVDSPSAAALILLSPISSVDDVANEDWTYRYLFRPAEWLNHKNDFDTKARISSVHMPVLIMTGTLDELAPPWMARAIYDRANGPKWIELVDGAHHNDFIENRDGTLLHWLKYFFDANSVISVSNR
jgi:pimeloyl-ACP methyl ester carboxylesterase